MERWIDLHTHSTVSDGSMTPSELVRHAKDRSLAAIALTDHDTTDGLAEAMEEGRRLGVEVIPGVEISVDYSARVEMHMLAYFVHGHYEPIRSILQELLESREQRNPKMIAKLNELGFDITLEEVEAIAGEGITGRPHVARALINKGYVGSMAEAFEKYIGTGKPAYFKKDKLTPAEGIAEIIKAGGIPVLAHPIYLDLDWENLDTLLGQLREYGLKGIEAVYAENTADQTQELLRLAEKHGLLVTGGSDFHGSYKPGLEIGNGRGSLQVPYELLERMRQA